MNTIRFFVLLFSLFLFAFIFRLQKTGENRSPEVLSEKVIQQTGYSAPKELHSFIYPNVTSTTLSKNKILLTTPDNIDDVLSWYYSALFAKPYGLNLYSEKDQTKILSANINGRHIVVTIKKIKDKMDVLIDLVVTTP